MAFDPTIIDNSQKIKLTLDSSAITTDQTDFPLTVVLDGTNELHSGLFADLGAVGSKKFSIESGATQLPVEIESYEIGGESFTPVYPASFSAATVKATSYINLTSYAPHFAADPALSLTGSNQYTSWSASGKGSMKFSIDLGEPKVAGRIRLDNAHYNGTSDFDQGIKDFIVYGTNETTAFADTTYAGTADLVELGSFSARMHISSNTEDPQYFELTNETAYRYIIFRISTNQGDKYNISIRHIAVEELVAESSLLTARTKVPTYSASVSTELVMAYDSTQDDNIYIGNTGDFYAGAVWDDSTASLITYTVYTELLEASLDQPYILSAGIIQAILEQSYAISSSININCFQLYSMVLETWITQYYGDVPYLTKPLSQPYGAAAVLQKSLIQRWGEALEMEVDLVQPWSMPGLLQINNEQRYGIVASVLTKTAEQLYNINALTSLFKVSHQAYAIAGETASLYQFDTKLYIDGELVPFTALQWESSENEYYWSCEATVATKELASKAVDGAELRIDWAGESLYLKCYDGWMLTKSFGSTAYRITGYSKSKDLSYAATMSGDVSGGMASTLCAGWAAQAGITIDWQMDDGYIQSGKLVANDETPLEMIRKVVWDCQGKLRPTLDGNLVAAYSEEVSVPDYPIVDPADTITARLERISTSESSDEQYGYNSFTVSDQLASSDSRNLVSELLDSKTAEIREYATPLYDGIEFELTHRGPSSVAIEPFGLTSEEVVDELVTFENGASSTSLPIYAITDKTWQTDSLGAVYFSEDGVLESEISGYGLLKISYITKFFKWEASHPDIADVLFVADETSEETV